MKKLLGKYGVLLVTVLTLGVSSSIPVGSETSSASAETEATTSGSELPITSSSSQEETSTSSTGVTSTEESTTASSSTSSTENATPPQSTVESTSETTETTPPPALMTVAPETFPVLTTKQRQEYGSFSGSSTLYRLNTQTKMIEPWAAAPTLKVGIVKISQWIKTESQIFYGVTSNNVTVYVPQSSLKVLGSYQTMNGYGSVLKKGFSLFTTPELTTKGTNGTTDALYQKTYRITEKLTRTDGTQYFLLADQKNVLGYVTTSAISNPEKTAASGVWLKAEGYATSLKAGSKFYRSLGSLTSSSIGNYQGKTVKVNGKYNHYNGKTYYSAYSNKNVWLGYLDAGSMTLTQKAQGNYQAFNKYVSITQNYYDVWGSFSWSRKTTAKTMYQRTYLAKGKYEHFNCATYYSLYDSKNNWLGYMNATGGKICSVSGLWQKESLYANRKTGSYPLWGDLNSFSAQKGDSRKLTNKTVKITGKYRHFNGSLYYSLYDNQGTWLGYMNANGLKTTKNQQGTYFEFNKYLTVTKTNYNTWSSFSFNRKLSNSSVYQRTYKAKGVYYHFNGSRYYSLYDNKNSWKGYISSGATTIANDAGGVWLRENMEHKISKRDYPIWSNTSMTKQISTTNQHYGKIYKVTGKYRHFNGSLYYSLYNNGKWVGYVNAGATSSPHTIYSTTSINKYVWINNGSGNFFSKADPSSSKRGAKSPYKGYMARASKQANTSNGTYYYLVMPGFELGWIKASETSATHEFWRHTTGGRYPSLNVPNLKIRVSVGKQRVTLLSGNREIYTMLCSTGTYGNDTPYGNFAIQREKGLWFWSAQNGGAAYYRSFLGHGVYLFHSITITGPGAINSFSARQGAKLGTRASHGCIRLSVADAIWFYNNIPYGTPVSVVR